MRRSIRIELAHLVRRDVPPIAILAVLAVLGGAGRAVAAEPWWHLSTISAPAAANSSEARIDVLADNVGDARTSGTANEHLAEALVRDETKGFITVVDKLPPGVSVSEVKQGGGGQGPNIYGSGLEAEFKRYEAFGFKPPKLCSVSGQAMTGQTVECKNGDQVWPYEQIFLIMTVKVAAGAGRGPNEVSISGGGAPSVISRRTLAVEGRPSYGVQSYELTPEEEGGSPNTQAGSHPFQLTTALMLNTQAVEVGPGGLKEDDEVQPVAFTKDLHFNLPPGLVGNPTPLPKCSVRQFLLFDSSKGKDLCPDDTVVGVATPIVSEYHGGGPPLLAQSFPLIMLEPSVGEPAKFGFTTPLGPVILDTHLRTGGDYGVVVTVSNITQALAFMGNIVTFWGVPPDARHNEARNYECLIAVEQSAEPGELPEASCPGDRTQQPLLIMPTSCTGPLRTTIEVDSWSEIREVYRTVRVHVPECRG